MAGMLLVTVGTAGASAGTTPHFGNFTCRGGTFGAPKLLKNGVYRSLTVTGVCAVPTGGVVKVNGNVTIDAHAGLNALSMSTFNVGGNVTVGNDALAGLGCSPEVGCPTLTNDHIGGSLTAKKAYAVLVQQEHIHGNASIIGGGGSENCSLTVLAGGPFFSTIEDSSVGGNILVQGVHSCWFGMFRLNVGGNVTVQGNRMGDPDGNEIGTNTIGGNLACYNNVPHAQFGDSGAMPNTVAGSKLGECKNL
jgi:hypothetical protein